MRGGMAFLAGLLASLPAAGQAVLPPLGDGPSPRPPTLIRPNGDALIVTAPGEPPTVVRRNDVGGQVIARPGQPPVVCRTNATGTACQ